MFSLREKKAVKYNTIKEDDGEGGGNRRASRLVNTLTWWENGRWYILERAWESCANPSPQCLILCIFSTELFLSCILYKNWQLTTTKALPLVHQTGVVEREKKKKGKWLRVRATGIKMESGQDDFKEIKWNSSRNLSVVHSWGTPLVHIHIR